MDFLDPGEAGDGRKLNTVSPRLKLDELFIAYLCLPEVQQNLQNLLKDVESGVPVSKSPYAAYRQALSPRSLHRSPSQSPSSSPTPERSTLLPSAPAVSGARLIVPGGEMGAPKSPRASVSPKPPSPTSPPVMSPPLTGASPLLTGSSPLLVGSGSLPAQPGNPLLQPLTLGSAAGGSGAGGLQPTPLAAPQLPQPQQQAQQPSSYRASAAGMPATALASIPERVASARAAAATAAVGPKPLPVPPWYAPRHAASSGAAAAEWVGPRRRVLSELFAARGGAMSARDLVPVVKQVLGLPAWFAEPVFRRLDRRGAGRVDQAQVEAFWAGALQSSDLATRVFAFLKAPDRDYLVPDDFRELMRALMDTHPGLEFLKGTPEFQERYAETVIHRMFYTVNRAGNGRMTLRELRRSDLPNVMLQLDDEPEINKVTRYFSYEHFYVIYCKFWELDTDHNQLIDKDDLLRYGQHALTFRIVERIFAGAGRKLRSGQPGFMGYEDFVWFILSEEDKNTDTALEYWFRCIDLDGDGVLSFYEMEHFYTEQLSRMEAIQMEPVGFLDILCQMVDMIKPARRDHITLRDLRRCQMAGNLFNVLFNLNKFIAIEQKDPFMSRGEAPESDWDKFARVEYDRLSAEDDQGGAGEPAVDEDDSGGFAWGADVPY